MQLFPERVETDRLRLDRLCGENVDLFEYYRICSADDGIEEVTRYLSWDPHTTVKETRDFIEETERAWNRGETATYAIRPREGEAGAGEIAGATALDVTWDRRLATMRIWLRRRFWGRGYSGERAAALFDLAFDRLDLNLVAVERYGPNERSRRAIEKYVERFGGVHEGVQRRWIVDDDGVYDQHRYSVTREEYREATERG